MKPVLASTATMSLRGTATSPAWRSPLWAEAVCVLDAVLWWGAPRRALDDWRSGAHRQAMLRAALFRVLSDQPCDVARYAALELA